MSAALDCLVDWTEWGTAIISRNLLLGSMDCGPDGFLNFRQYAHRRARYGEPIQHTGNVLREITDGWT
jgi:hypothetical protein